MDIYICTDADGFIEGVTSELESAKALIGADKPGATLTWKDTPLGGSYCTIDRHNGWGPQHYATIDQHELQDELLPGSNTGDIEP